MYVCTLPSFVKQSISYLAKNHTLKYEEAEHFICGGGGGGGGGEPPPPTLAGLRLP